VRGPLKSATSTRTISCSFSSSARRLRGQPGRPAAPRQQLQQLIDADAGGPQPLQHVVQAVRLRRRTGDLVIAPASDAVHALGEIDHLKIRRERAAEAVRGRGIEAGELGGKLGHRLVALAAPDRGGARGFDVSEERLAVLLDQQLADEAAKAAYVVTQGPVAGSEFDIAQFAHH
jgi:hypothetical protein